MPAIALIKLEVAAAAQFGLLMNAVFTMASSNDKELRSHPARQLGYSS